MIDRRSLALLSLGGLSLLGGLTGAILLLTVPMPTFPAHLAAARRQMQGSDRPNGGQRRNHQPARTD